jgi:hypothetical protein
VPAWTRAARGHPVITAVMLAATVAGVVLGPAWLPESLSLWRRILGGAIGGAGVGLLLTAYRMIGD